MATIGKFGIVWEDGTYPHVEAAIKQADDHWLLTMDWLDRPGDHAKKLERLAAIADSSFQEKLPSVEKDLHAFLQHWENMMKFKAFL
jgi:hypothetical protein